ncbi:MAG: hypothetical protein FWH55_13495 [Oscillospiraceae bacterium]|nr:hypothetical protein [Oscillospiraceae bacterium]
MENKQFKVVVTYDSKGNTIEEVFYNILKQKLLSCEKSGLDSQQEEAVQWEAQDK